MIDNLDLKQIIDILEQDNLDDDQLETISYYITKNNDISCNISLLLRVMNQIYWTKIEAEQINFDEDDFVDTFATFFAFIPGRLWDRIEEKTREIEESEY